MLITLAAVFATVGVMRMVMPPLASAVRSLSISGQATDADINNVINIVEAQTPANTTVEVWAKNVGDEPIADLHAMSVQFGRESNAVPYTYGGAGCAAPCWSYDLAGANEWSPLGTIAVRINLTDAMEPSSLYRVTLLGPRGGDSSVTFRASTN